MIAILLLFKILEWAIILDVILSMAAQMGYAVNIYRSLNKFTGPILEPFRRLQDRLNLNLPIDFSPLLALLAIQFIQSLLFRVL
ncbi:YggT family protein [Clostridium sp. 'White wine YQ']|uniref:YggT family protein n=1 Tax=Clostridium sp. 'White wine YQ' TaxID=3027474 RepID=UPI0023670EA2|nr:YggT family protein [Clostridium sp. 'White wine YQ']MDD7793966.1 YggT family protein [Clostridium sp. 'White wine YQ']